MKIALLTNEYPPNVYGGAGVHVEYLTRELAKLDDGAHQINVFSFGDQREDHGNLRVHGVQPIGEAPATDERHVKFLQTLQRDIVMAGLVEEADVVHCHTWYSHLAGCLVKQLAGAHLVLTTHSLEPHRPWKVEQLGTAYHGSSWIEQYSTPLAVSELQADDGCGAFNGEDGTFGDYQFRLAWTSSSGERLTSEVVTQTVRASERRVFVYPNPATSTARIRLVLDETQRVAIALYSASGQRVATLYDRERRADDGRPIRVGSELLGGLASGVYFLRFRGEEFVENRQLVLVR